MSALYGPSQVAGKLLGKNGKREKLTELDNERIAKLDEEIVKLIKQELALFLIEEKG